MAAETAVVFEAFFQELTRRKIPFVILHNYESMPENIPSDIDFAVRCEDLSKLISVARAAANQHGWYLASAVCAKIYSLTLVLFDGNNPHRFLQLDACSHYVEGNNFVLCDTELLEKRVAQRFLFVPRPAIEFSYILAKSLLKQRPLEPYLPRLRTLAKGDDSGAAATFKRLTGESDLVPWLTRPSSEWDNQLREKIRPRTTMRLADCVREWGRLLQRTIRPVGLHIVLLGPDGTGKSTLISRLSSFACFRRQCLFHFRPGLLDKKEAGKPVTQPHAQSPRSGIFSFLKTFYYFADHWFGYWLKVYPARVRDELVIFDRGFEDVLVDPRRYRMSNAGAWARFLKRLIPGPDLTFVLDAEPALIHARKPELSIEELTRQREALRQLAQQTPRCTVISVAQAPEEVERAVRVTIIQFLAAREEKHHPD